MEEEEEVEVEEEVVLLNDGCNCAAATWASRQRRWTRAGQRQGTTQVRSWVGQEDSCSRMCWVNTSNSLQNRHPIRTLRPSARSRRMQASFQEEGRTGVEETTLE